MAKYQYQIMKEVKNSDGSVETSVVKTATTKREIESSFNGLLRIMKKSKEYGLPIRYNQGWAGCCYYGYFGIEDFELYICKVAI